MGIGVRIKMVRGTIPRREFGKAIGVGTTTIQNYETKDQVPKGHVLQRIANEFNVDINWLLTGKGKPYIKDKVRSEENGPGVVAGDTTSGKGFKISDAIAMAVRVLESNTPYAVALYLNIQQFNRAIQAEARITDLESENAAQADRIAQLERKNEALEKRLAALEEKVKAPPPAEGLRKSAAT